MRTRAILLVLLTGVLAATAGFVVARWPDGQWSPGDRSSEEAVTVPDTKSSSGESVLNRPMPELTLPDIDGNTRHAADWQGRVLIINFWATWCAPCLDEIPLFVELQSATA